VTRPTTSRDLAVVLVLVGLVVCIGLHAPSHSYAYAQMRQMGATVGMIQSNNWLLPRNHEGLLARKPQLYSWLTAPVLMLTGIYNDLTFRWPSVAAALACGVLVYLLGRRWYGPGVGLMAACLWAVCLHMGKLMFLGTTDMLNALWITAAIFCADRVLFHRAPRSRRGRWVVGFWVTTILGAMTKGWGVLNLPLVGGWIALVAGFGPGFGAVRGVGGPVNKCLLVVRLVGRRWVAAAKDAHIVWGLAALAAVLAPVWAGMLAIGGDEFLSVADYEILQRAFGHGVDPPGGSSLPAVVWLLYCTLPASVFAFGALASHRPRGWLVRGGALMLPLWWIVAVVVPFSLTHGFRPDYLFPCYAAVALLGAVGIERLGRLEMRKGRWVSVLRHLFALTAICLGFFTAASSLAYLFHEYLPAWAAKWVKIPPVVADETWFILAGLTLVGLITIVVAIRASLRWQLRTVAAAAIVAMLGVIFIDRHMISRHARTGDGQTLIAFARSAGRIVGNDPFAVCRAENLGTELYWGRFGTLVRKQRQLGKLGAKWLVTCDLGLVRLGAFRQSPVGHYQAIIGGKPTRVRPLPAALGHVADLGIDRPIRENNMGRVYLIRLPQRPHSRTTKTPD